MSQTQIILIVAALVVIAFFFWRSMREERRMRASRKARLQAGGDVRKDVLAEEKPEPRVEPQLEDMVDDDERTRRFSLPPGTTFRLKSRPSTSVSPRSRRRALSARPLAAGERQAASPASKSRPSTTASSGCST